MTLGGIVEGKATNLRLFERMEDMLRGFPTGTKVRLPVFVSDKEHGAPYFAVEKAHYLKNDMENVKAYFTAVERFVGDIIGKDVEIRAGIEVHKIV